MEMFETEFSKLLDCSFERMAELAEDASRKGWINCKRIGSVIEIVFPNLITQKELDQLYEKN
jgi:frataxin-like iron-binding protein CyaY